MKTFKDSAGREWSISVNVAAVKRVRTLAGVDLLGLLDPSSGTAEKLSDPVTLGDVLYAAVQPQAERLGVTDEQFGESLAGDAIHDATQALIDEIVDFSPNPRGRAAMQKVRDAARVVTDRALTMIEAAVEGKTTEQLADAMCAGGGNSSTSVPGSSESTPTP